MALGNTVYDRYKKTGYMMGSGHKMGPAMEDAPPMQPQAQQGGPPNHRDSGGAAESCGNCAQFDSAGQMCGKFGARTTPNMVCDGYEPMSMEESEGGDSIGGGAY